MLMVDLGNYYWVSFFSFCFSVLFLSWAIPLTLTIKQDNSIAKIVQSYLTIVGLLTMVLLLFTSNVGGSVFHIGSFRDLYVLLRCLTLNIDYSHFHLKVLVYRISVSRTYSLSER